MKRSQRDEDDDGTMPQAGPVCELYQRLFPLQYIRSPFSSISVETTWPYFVVTLTSGFSAPDSGRD